MNKKEDIILIVEDDVDVADMLREYFHAKGYAILIANWGEDGYRMALDSRPDLVILDIRLPDIDGFEVARRLGENRRTDEIPIIFLTEKRERVDRLKGLELHAVDYITKPFDIQELHLKVRNALNRVRQATLTDPITGLPVGELVEENLTQFLNNPNWTVLVISLLNTEPFRETYGFVAADDLRRAAAIMLENTLRSSHPPTVFLGQTQPDQFIIASASPEIESLAEPMIRRLEQSFNLFHSHQDRASQQFNQRRISVKITPLRSTQYPKLTFEQLKQELFRLNH